MTLFKQTLILICSAISFSAYATTYVIPMKLISDADSGKSIGTITVTDSKYGLMLTPNLQGLPPGAHGFHLHQNPSCAKEGMAAGGHFDPHQTDQHLGPYNTQGHMGDIPPLLVNQNGTATLPLVAPRLTTQNLKGHALMIHEGGDNYSDSPEKLGGGGKRIACGVIY